MLLNTAKAGISENSALGFKGQENPTKKKKALN